jgi:hypothetical protein
LTGASYSNPETLTFSALYISGYCSLTLTAVNDLYGDQTAYGNASVTGGTPNGSGKYKGSITVTAVPNPGYVFVKWVADNDRTAPALSANSSYMFTIQSDTTICAVFNRDGTSASAPIEVWDAGTLSGGAYLTDATDAAASGTLNGMRNGLAKHYKLVKDINLAGTWTSVGGYSASPFTGTLDGNGKTITFGTGSLLAPVDNFAGIFCYINSGSVTVAVQNLTVAGSITVTSTTKLAGAGAIVGYLNSSIQQCAVTASLNAGLASNYLSPGNQAGGIGGIAGYMHDGTITASYVTNGVSAGGGDDSQYAPVGGIVGQSEYGTVRHCYTTGVVSGGRYNRTLEIYAGGIVGTNRQGTVEYCYTTGDVSAGNSSWPGIAGGIVGTNYATVRNCVALNTSVRNGAATGPHRIAGRNDGALSDNYGRKGLINSTADDAADRDGAMVDLVNTQVQTWWFNSGGVFYSYNGSGIANPWTWKTGNQRPSFYWEN